MWYDINWNVFGMQNLPFKWRDLNSISFVKVILKPINDIYYKWYNWRIDNIYKLENTGQICYLRGSLNDKFDALERRIYIGDGLLFETTYIFTEAEEIEVHTNTEAEDNDETLWVYTEAETADSELDFIVYVPTSILNNELYALKAHIDFYRAAGKRYAIIEI